MPDKQNIKLTFWTAWWSYRYNARTKSEGAVVQSPNQPKNICSKGYYVNHLLHIVLPLPPSNISNKYTLKNN